MVLGGRTVAEWQKAMSIQEFKYWIAFNSIEPIGETRADQRTAAAAFKAATIGSGMVNKTDFMPSYDWEVYSKKELAVNVEQKLSLFVGMHNKRIEYLEEQNKG